MNKQTITIMNDAGYPLEQIMIEACLSRAARYFHEDATKTNIEIIIYVGQRTPQTDTNFPGWCEYSMRITTIKGDPEQQPVNANHMFIAVIQRSIGAEIESHS